MNLWEFEGGIVCTHSCPVCFLWGGSSLLGATEATLWVTPLVFMWHQHGSTGWRTHPRVLAGLGGFREHSTGNQLRTYQGAGCLAATMWPVTLCYRDPSLGQKKCWKWADDWPSCQGTASSMVLSICVLEPRWGWLHPSSLRVEDS